MTFTTLITAADLHALIGQPDVRVFDCSFDLGDVTAGQRLFEAGHIPSASYADLEVDLSGDIIAGITGRHPLPPRATFVSRLSAWGVTRNTQVIAYDGGAGAHAARLWWMLRWVGHANVAVLDGGMAAWRSAGYTDTDVVEVFASQEFQPGAPLTITVSADDLPAPAALVLDAREVKRYDGDVEPIDAVAGHIPGAVCAPFAENLDADGRFHSRAVLAERFAELGVGTKTRVICYCGSGVTAAHNILALKHAGFEEPALYPGSWSEWITDPGRPVATR